MKKENLFLAPCQNLSKVKLPLGNLILFFFCFCLGYFSNGQTGSPALQAFEYVADGSGNKFRLLDINVDSPNPFGKNTGGGTTTVNSAASCQAGYFTLHYNPTSFLSSNTNSLALQNVICQVFSDISNLIISPLSAVTNSAPIHILCSNLNASGYAATGEAIFAYPNNPINPNQGFILSEVQRSIQTGLPPYSNLSAVSAPAVASFYAGYLDISPTVNWSTNMTSASLTPSGFTDLYSIVLHEAMHILGFASLINYDGFSKIGPSQNYFSYYDKFLKSGTGIPLLLSNTSGCSSNNIVWNTALTSSVLLGSPCGTTAAADITPTNCSQGVFYVSPTNTVAVYTPTCFQGPSSLSHFEDVCSTPPTFSSVCTATPANNNLYFLMSNANLYGDCYIKRYPKPEERNVLCNLGYQVKANYVSTNTTVAIANTTYSYGPYPGGVCAPVSTVIGNHDGLVAGLYTFTTIGSSAAITTQTILNNDLPASGLQVSCLELLYGSSASFTNQGGIITVTATPGSGLVVLKYIPTFTASNTSGPVTYIYVNFLLTTCVPTSTCNFVQNGGFENQTGGDCGLIYPQSTVNIVNCWQSYFGSPVTFANACTSSAQYSFNTVNSLVLANANSFNGAPNNRFSAIKYSPAGDTDGLQNNLAVPLQPGQTYQISFWARNVTNPVVSASVNPNAAPCVLNFVSAPLYPIGTGTIYQPAGLNSLTNFTINAGNFWTLYTGTFAVAGPTINQNCLVVGFNYPQTFASSGGMGLSGNLHLLLDDISILPLNSATFVIPGSSICGNTTYTNLAQYASPFPGSFSGSGVSSVVSGTTTTYNFSQTTAGIYPIAFNYTNNGCSGVVYQNVVVQPVDNLVLSVSSSSYCANSGLPAVGQATANQTGFIYSWQPGYLSGATQTLNASNTIYTVTAQSASCAITQTLLPPISNSCCVSSFTPFNAPVLTSSLVGNFSINSDLVIPQYEAAFLKGNFIIAPNVKITVSSVASLQVTDAHLYACSNVMWNGIETVDNAVLSIFRTNQDNLIEDAILAVNASLTTGSPPTISISNSTFNKNFQSIEINSGSSMTDFPLKISKCVFTCRTLTTTLTQWPQTGTLNTSSGANADLRYTAINTNSTLAPPYLIQSGMSLVNLKAPYANQTSQLAIGIKNTANQPVNFTVGDGSVSANFNLFDGHGTLIEAINANLNSYNNIFQNTQLLQPGTFNSGIRVVNTYTNAAALNTTLNLVSSVNPSQNPNRFYNCHTAIEAHNQAALNIQHAYFASTQNTSTAVSLNTPGYYGVYIRSNRFHNYNINNNRFYNLNTGVYANAIAGWVNPAANTFGQSWGSFNVVTNTFCPVPGFSTNITSEFINEAVHIETSLRFLQYFRSNEGDFRDWGRPPISLYFVGPVNGIKVLNNTIFKVYNGVYVGGFYYSGFGKTTANNSILLKQKPVANVTQTGVNHTNNYLSSITGNTVAGFSAATNFTVAGIYNSLNPAGSTQCNSVVTLPKGFEFYGSNRPHTWRSNTMLNNSRGLYANSWGTNPLAGGIGAQGSSTQASDNFWQGSWSATMLQTNTDLNSSGANSKLFTRSSPAGYGLNLNWNNGIVSQNSYNNAAYSFSLATGPFPQCSPATPGVCLSCNAQQWRVVPPDSLDFEDPTFAVSQFMLFQSLDSDSILLANSDDTLQNFYAEHIPREYGQLADIEAALASGQFQQAGSLLSNFSPSDNVQENYQHFFTAFLNSVVNEMLFYSDSLSLLTLAYQCPASDGPAVYKARALYNDHYKTILEFNDDNCVPEGFALRSSVSSQIQLPKSILVEHEQFTRQLKKITYRIYPNPNAGELFISGATANEKLHIVVSDMTSRILFDSFIQCNADGKFTQALDISKGVYFISVGSSKSKITRKIILTK